LVEDVLAHAPEAFGTVTYHEGFNDKGAARSISSQSIGQADSQNLAVQGLR
jgi:hypothetical protein